MCSPARRSSSAPRACQSSCSRKSARALRSKDIPPSATPFACWRLKSGGEYFEFDPEKPRAAEQLGAQLNAIARMAVGDTTALTDQRNRK